MRVTLLLADAAQAANGKLYVLGGGWSVTGPAPTPHAVAIKIDVPWDQANVKHHWRLALETEDGAPVRADTPEGEQPIKVEGDFEVGRPPGIAPGTPIDLPLAIGVGPVQLASGTRYLWRFSIDDRSEPDWHLAFNVRSDAPG